MTHPTAPAQTRPDLDALADQITIGVLIEAFAQYGITPRAFCAAWHAVLHSSAFERSTEHGVWCACVPSECPANAGKGGADARTVRDN